MMKQAVKLLLVSLALSAAADTNLRAKNTDTKTSVISEKPQKRKLQTDFAALTEEWKVKPLTDHVVDKTMGYGNKIKFNQKAAEDCDDTVDGDCEYLVELPLVKAGTKVVCSVDCGSGEYGGASTGTFEGFSMFLVVTDATNEDATGLNGIAFQTAINSCQSTIGVTANADEKVFFQVSDNSLAFSDATITCDKVNANCGYVETVRNYFTNWGA